MKSERYSLKLNFYFIFNLFTFPNLYWFSRSKDCGDDDDSTRDCDLFVVTDLNSKNIPTESWTSSTKKVECTVKTDSYINKCGFTNDNQSTISTFQRIAFDQSLLCLKKTRCNKKQRTEHLTSQKHEAFQFS